MYKQLDLFIKSQPSDLEKLDDMVSYQDTSTVELLDTEEFRLPYRSEPMPSSQLDWDIQQAIDSGDHQRLHELYTIKHDMN
tara:strand:+ start:6562 stop:6804 length:243 start_codon:yes stop_codon:yes gene_type:complete